jgi:uncharacterized lipoprotein YmbA
MKNRKIGNLTLSLGFILLGILMLLNFTNVVSYEVFQYVGPSLIILFGLEIIWSHLSRRDSERRYSGSSVALLVIVVAISLTQSSFPGNIGWQPRFLSAVQGDMTVESGIHRVEIQIPNGKVEVTGTTDQKLTYEGKLTVNASTQAKADETMKANWKVKQSDDVLVISLEQPESKFSLSNIFDWTQNKPYLNLQIPQALLTKIQTANGSVHVNAMQADTDIKASNGSITVRNEHGNVKAITSNGSGNLSDIDGSADVHTTNGSFTLENISGVVTAQTTNGSINGSSVINGKWDCKSTNGRITLTVPHSTNASIQANTSNGSIGGDLQWQKGEKTEREGIIGAGLNPVILKTSNGKIVVNYS